MTLMGAIGKRLSVQRFNDIKRFSNVLFCFHLAVENQCHPAFLVEYKGLHDNITTWIRQGWYVAEVLHSR